MVTALALLLTPPSLADIDGKRHTPTDAKRPSVLMFLGDECPISNAYAPEIGRIVKEYTKKGVRFFFVYPEPEVTVTEARQHQREFGIAAPTILDRKQEWVRFAGATRMPEVAVYAAGGKSVYLGRIDDRYPRLGVKRKEPSRRDLRLTLDALLAGKPIRRTVTPAVGCAIPR